MIKKKSKELRESKKYSSLCVRESSQSKPKHKAPNVRIYLYSNSVIFVVQKQPWASLA